MTLLFWLLIPAATAYAYALYFNRWWVYLPAVWWEHRRDCVQCWWTR